jgi:hypothetical protein
VTITNNASAHSTCHQKAPHCSQADWEHGTKTKHNEDLATDSVTIVEKNMGAKDKGGRNKITNDQKDPGTIKVRSNKKAELVSFFPITLTITSLMLTLDTTTLFYFSLRDLDGKDKNTSLIKDWAKQIPAMQSQEVLTAS